MNNRRESGTFQLEDDHFSENAQSISKRYLEVFLVTKFLQTKPQVKYMKINFYDLFYTMIKNRDEEEFVDDQYENNENDCIKYEGFIMPNHNISNKPRETILK